MAVKVVLTNKSQQTGLPTKINTTGSADVNMSRMTYQYLRSLVKAKTIKADYDAGLLPKEFMVVLDELDKLLQGESVSTSISKLDSYLGELGITVDYPFSKDFLKVDPWVTESVPSINRNVLALVDGITYNVITLIASITYNVTHNKASA